MHSDCKPPSPLNAKTMICTKHYLNSINMNTRIFLGLLFLSSLSVLSCRKAAFGDQVILVTGTEVGPIVKFTVENTPSEYLVTATSTQKAPQNINVTFALDTAAVAAYNKENRTTYYVAPAAAITITNLSTVIKAGSSASTAVSVKIISTSPLVDGRSYLIPLSIKSVTGGDMGVLESSRTIF